MSTKNTVKVKKEGIGYRITEGIFKIESYYPHTDEGLEDAKTDLQKIADRYVVEGYEDCVHILMIQRLYRAMYDPSKHFRDPFDVVFMFTDLQEQERQMLSDESYGSDPESPISSFCD